MSKIDQLVKTIVKAIDEKDRKKTSALDTVATVSRIDGDTAWVKFAGSDSETPVKQTIAVKKGDKVQVRASKGSAWITGNITSPPTDNTLAEEAVKKSDTATKRAKRAEDMSIVADVMYYLASDKDEGVTTEDEGWTQEPQEATVALPYLWCYHEYTRGNGTKFNSDPVIISRYTEGGAGVQSITTYYALGTSTSTAPTSGWATTFSFRSGYYIWRKELISLTDGTTTWSAPVYDGGLTEACELAFDAAQYIWTQPSASATTSVPSGQYVTEVDKDSYRTSPSGGALLLRSAGIYLRNGINTVASFLDAGVKLFDLAGNTLAEFLSSGLTIYNGSGTEIAHLGYGSTSDSGTTTQSPYYTLGKRKSGSTIGAYSLGVGSNATASGTGSLAIGKDCIAESTGKLAIGYYNSNTSTNAFEVGNGGSTNNRNTSFAVSYTGNINADGSATIGGSISASSISASGNASITGSLSANSVTIGGHSNAIGYTTEASSSSDLTTKTSWENITGAYVSLGAGTWVIEGMASITSASSSTSTPNPNVGVRINGSSPYGKGAQIVPALGAGQVIAVAIATVSSGTKNFYVQAKKSGGSVVVGGGIKAVRIA